ncbi:hypothetical protein NMB32_12775 [Stenotrophomonas sp. CD2]|nr:hypothetical protein NMB32_12775 [Stenotrophomonas sp. CD2]
MNLPTLATARGQLDRLAPWLAPLGLRLLLAWSTSNPAAKSCTARTGSPTCRTPSRSRSTSCRRR